jgi:NADPH-dependent 2,4-dienoyl-CoA reductase/sulfur reductase-like enzyme
MRLLVIGGSDAGIAAALRARELDSSADVTVVVADAFPNFSICGLPYYLSGDVPDWRDLAHRTTTDLEQAGIQLRLTTPPEGSTRPPSRSPLPMGTAASASSATTGWSSAPARFRSAPRSKGWT